MNIDRNILMWTAGLLMLSAILSCNKEPSAVTTEPEEEFNGEMVLFTSGTTDNIVSKAAAKTYYMPDSYRFVCRMYYKASMASDKFDVTGGTDATAWLKVSGDMGHSLYWRRNYPSLDPSNSSLFDSYSNDAAATCFYWQNRKEHAFLAWTDLNRATTNSYSPLAYSGSLKFEADEDYSRTTGSKIDQWVETGLEMHGRTSRTFSSWANLRSYLESGSNYVSNVKDQIPAGVDPGSFDGAKYYYAYGLSCKYSEVVATDDVAVDGKHKKFGWIQYQMFYDKVEYEGPKTSSDDPSITVITADGVDAFLYNTVTNRYVAAIEITYDESDPPVEQSRAYYATDPYGNVRYDENRPRYVFYFKRVMELKTVDEVVLHPANVFDLRSEGKSSISQQPDICQALTIQAPLGATQASNRVNLYFKHQFSQIQVNIKGSADESVSIAAGDIRSVQLLGVSDKGYVFTELNEEGEVLPTTYEAVDISKYSAEQLAENEYGTAFDMFDMGAQNYALGYLKSFNAITFGQLQAIRIRWVESATGIEHKSTFVVSETAFKDLKSGTRYVWNIELRRGTLAVVQAEIVDWIVPASGYEHTTSGTIKD